MPPKLRSEKRMRKLLIEQIKTRKVLGARIADGFKQPQDLINLNLAPQVFLFKNLFSGQVLYSQVPAYHQNQIDEQFIRPNWQNRKPARRNDLWRIMCVATFDNYEYATAAYKGLVQLRKTRDIIQKDEAQALRRKNDEGNIWYHGQYRPTYSQEAVADLSHVIEEFELENTTLSWENDYRRGEDKYWRADLVEHETLPAFNPKTQTVLLDELRAKALEAFAVEREQSQAQAQDVEENASVIA
ncbi:transcriptional regulation of mitochondrial recombination-domain-containing protein [Scheffersomyces coipomensis]|uniref:transcriptional regulation of mitochondrial recombination-domain-containing protein n=1 Tax=Scheffersomyces coipomensis TaxID=1788519 RepID=UPI00315C8586